MKTVNITVKPGGKVVVETNGFTSNQCQQYSRALLEKLAADAKVETKPEFYMETVATADVTAGDVA